MEAGEFVNKMKYKIMNYGRLSNCNIEDVDTINYSDCCNFINKDTFTVMINKNYDDSILLDFVWMTERYPPSYEDFCRTVLLTDSCNERVFKKLLAKTLDVNVLSDSAHFRVVDCIYSTLLDIPLDHIHLLPESLYLDIIMNLDKLV